MLYFAVGSRDLDGGLVCTASHNPKAYTGAKLVRRGAIALSGDSGIGELRELVTEGEPRPAGRAARRIARGRRRRGLPRGGAALHRSREGRADEGRARRRQRHGRADGRADPRLVPDRAGADVLGAGRGVPRPRAEPAARGEPARSSSTRCSRRAPTWASPGTATPTAASSSTTPASSSRATSSRRCSPSRSARRSRAPRILYDVRASRAVRDVVEGAGGTR